MSTGVTLVQLSVTNGKTRGGKKCTKKQQLRQNTFMLPFSFNSFDPSKGFTKPAI